MDKQLAQHRTQEQGSRIAAAAHLNYEFAMYRSNEGDPDAHYAADARQEQN
jgi:hypothetical protein